MRWQLAKSQSHSMRYMIRARCEEKQFIVMANSGNHSDLLDSSETNMRADRISGLPLPLLHHILSFLPTQNVVQTCVLSKHWRDIWCSVPSLDLDQRLLAAQKIDFVGFVDFLLLLRDGLKIQKFRLYLTESPDDMSRVNAWIMYALKHNVEVMDINIVHETKLTPRIFTCGSLREFKLSWSSLTLPASVCLLALRTLHLNNVDLQDDQLLSAIPSLETLILETCFFQDNKLTISSLHLKKLILDSVLPTSIEICAPNLISLKINPCQEFPETVRFNSDLIHLIDACIHVPVSCFGSMIQLFSLLKSVHSLTLASLFRRPFEVKLQDLPTPRHVQAPFYNLKWLKIITSFSDCEILVIITILNRSPQIETIFLENEVAKDACDTTTSEAEKVWFKHELCHLKLVEFKGFRGSVNEVKFVEFLLENAIVLENLIIMNSKPEEGTSEEMKKTGRKLLKYPRASSSVGILFA